MGYGCAGWQKISDNDLKENYRYQRESHRRIGIGCACEIKK